MLSIRKEQMEVLSGYMREQFEWRMVKHLREKFPDRTKDLADDKIRVVVQSSMKKAEGYGIEYEDDIRRFLEYLVIYGTRLDVREETQWIGDILRRNDLTGTAKMNLIDSRELEALRGPKWVG
ncbi:hypothetical protein [Candidatus Contendibacter odensensis]|uniref:Uncharacterized protein n=1 Tax=Candidatus Contendobacter odensis Run_B_J11 TaxID=1400861 RepID=A0A7U7J3Z5_9GAMM|nr:hypothetical protein [Candidatus Contendobacter odensis]MBK8750338.1 hypothetical protein [Candidatus Competibacteraceae bacterium]CDH44861.1 hypothetical protein BN874_1940005 [Candidatus Contendobacter odensis Run_B_J11]